MSTDEYNDGYEYDPNVDKIGPALPPKGHIEIFSLYPNYGMPEKETLEDIDAQADESLRSQGATVHSETYYPASNRTVKR